MPSMRQTRDLDAGPLQGDIEEREAYLRRVILDHLGEDWPHGYDADE